MATRINISIAGVWEEVNCEDSKISIAGVWEDPDCDNIGISIGGSWEDVNAADEDVCCGTATASGFAFDDANTPDTITAGGNIQVFTIDGCPTLTWETDSLGYSFSEETTTTGVNTLNCAAGTCGVDYDPFCTFTVTDVCSGVVEGGVINATGGGWDEVGDRYRTVTPGKCVGSGFFCDCPAGSNHCVYNTTSGVMWNIQLFLGCAKDCIGYSYWDPLIQSGSPVDPPAPYDTPDGAGQTFQGEDSCGYPANPPQEDCTGVPICLGQRYRYYERTCAGSDTPKCLE